MKNNNWFSPNFLVEELVCYTIVSENKEARIVSSDAKKLHPSHDSSKRFFGEIIAWCIKHKHYKLLFHSYDKKIRRDSNLYDSYTIFSSSSQHSTKISIFLYQLV